MTRYCSCGKEFEVQFTDNGLERIILYEDGDHYKVCPRCGQGNYAKELLTEKREEGKRMARLLAFEDGKKRYFARTMEAFVNFMKDKDEVDNYVFVGKKFVEAKNLQMVDKGIWVERQDF